MAATVSVSRFFGAGPSEDAAISQLIFKWADDNTDDNNDPIVRGAGNVWSWAKSIKMKIDTTPDNDITNLRFFSAAANFGGSHTGVSMLAVAEGSYAQGNSADESAARSSMANRLEGSPLVVNAGTVISNPSTGFGTQDYTALQLKVTNTVPAGESPTQTQTFRYAET